MSEIVPDHSQLTNDELSEREDTAETRPDSKIIRRRGVISIASVEHAPKVKKYEIRTGIFNPENTREYIKDRYEENFKMLEKLGDVHTLELYEELMNEYPQLRCIKLEDDDIYDNAFFRNHDPRKSPQELQYPEIHFNFSNQRNYTLNPEDDSRLARKYSTKRLSFMLGADWKKCAKHEHLISDEILLHEFGHAYDFIENFIRPEYNALSGDARGPAVLFAASRKNAMNREEYERLSPTPNWEARGSGTLKEYEHRLKAMGIDNYDEYCYAINQYYRDQPDEAFADQFAYDYILKHYDDYFSESKDCSDGRICVDKNKPMELDPDFVHILGIKQGLGVSISRIQDGKMAKQITGHLATNFYAGKSVYLYENGDPKNPGGKWRICQGVSGIFMAPVLDPKTNRLKHIVTFTDQDGTLYHISRTHEEVPVVDASPAEMAADLGLKVGDKVQLIKHLPKKDAREMTEKAVHNNWYPNWPIEGIVKNIDRVGKDTNAVISFQENGVGDQLNLAYPPKRKWKTYYMGNYEIIPLPKQTQEEKTQ